MFYKLSTITFGTNDQIYSIAFTRLLIWRNVYSLLHVCRTFFTSCKCKTVDMGTCVDMATNGECYTVVMVINFSHLPLLVSFRLHQPLFCWIVIALKNKSVLFLFFFRWTYIIIFFYFKKERLLHFAIVSFISASSYSLCQCTLHVEVVAYKKKITSYM